MVIVDHVATDGMSLLQCFSMMQDGPYDKISNSVPFPKRKNYTSKELFMGINDWIKVMELFDEKFKAIKNVGKGRPCFKKDYHLSDDLSLAQLK